MRPFSKIHSLVEKIHRGGKHEKESNAVREEQWIQTIAAAKQSGQPIKVWCAEHGVSVSSFYKWQQKMKDNLPDEERQQ